MEPILLLCILLNLPFRQGIAPVAACLPNTVFVSVTHTLTITAAVEHPSTLSTTEGDGITSLANAPSSVLSPTFSTTTSTTTKFRTLLTSQTVSTPVDQVSTSSLGYSMIVESDVTSWFDDHSPAPGLSYLMEIRTLTSEVEDFTTITIQEVKTQTATLTAPPFTSTTFTFSPESHAFTTTSHVTRTVTVHGTTTIATSESKSAFKGLPSSSLGWNETVSSDSFQFTTTLTGEKTSITSITTREVTSTFKSTSTLFHTTTTVQTYPFPFVFANSPIESAPSSESASHTVSNEGNTPTNATSMSTSVESSRVTAHNVTMSVGNQSYVYSNQGRIRNPRYQTPRPSRYGQAAHVHSMFDSASSSSSSSSLSGLSSQSFPGLERKSANSFSTLVYNPTRALEMDKESSASTPTLLPLTSLVVDN